MKIIIVLFVVALVLAPVLNVNPQTWPGSYAHWHPSDSRVEALMLAWNDAPPQPQPLDGWTCIWHPTLCGCPPAGCGL